MAASHTSWRHECSTAVIVMSCFASVAASDLAPAQPKTICFKCFQCRWTTPLCRAHVQMPTSTALPLKVSRPVVGGPGARCPRPGHGLVPTQALTDGKGGKAADLRWPRARSVHSQRQTISIISASPGAITDAALQQHVVHVKSRRHSRNQSALAGVKMCMPAAH